MVIVVRLALELVAGLRNHVELAARQRSQPSLLALLMKLQSPNEPAVVGDAHSGRTVGLTPVDVFVDVRRAIEHGI